MPSDKAPRVRIALQQGLPASWNCPFHFLSNAKLFILDACLETKLNLFHLTVDAFTIHRESLSRIKTAYWCGKS